MSYRVELASAALAALQRMPAQVLSRLSGPIEALGATPRPDSSRKVGGEGSDWRFRIGKYRVLYKEDTTWRMMVGPFRVLYDVYDDRSLVVVLKVDRDSSSGSAPEQTAKKANANP